MKITEKFTDMAGKSRILVEITPEESLMLKYDELPSDEEILNEATKIIERREAERKAKENPSLESQTAKLEEQIAEIEGQIIVLEEQIEP